VDGQVSPPNTTERTKVEPDDLSAGWRLACQAQIASDVRVHVPPESLATQQRIQTEGHTLPIELDPAVRTLNASMALPALEDSRSDAVRLRDAIGCPALTFDLAVLRCLSSDLRAYDFRASVFLNGAKVVGVRPQNTSALGLAVDLGTTKIAVYLVDLATGATLALAGAMNPQIAFGDDVMSRISHATKGPESAAQLRSAVVESINRLATDLCAQSQRDLMDVADAVIVGNTAMHHLFLGLPVKQLGLAPFVAAESEAIDVPARELGLNLAPGACIHLLPNIAGFVGADHVAMLLATELPKDEGVVLAMDIGTNTEVSLIARGKHWSCSVASGPAFEGGHIQYGMRAASGAIESVVLRDGQVLLKTVEDKPPVGICGSGLLELLAELLRARVIDARGVMSTHSSRMRQGPHGWEFMVVTSAENAGKEISFSRADLSELQLAKAAIRAGVSLLLQRADVIEADIDEVVIAGAFGTYLDVQSGIDIGMFPRIDRHRFKQVGNAAGAGARMALLSRGQRERAARIARQVEYVELTVEKDFASNFARALLLQ
jgi:uncharacterized 2Fe-2S/4Fe-4S cluster protein (DUF4445 family)